MELSDKQKKLQKLRKKAKKRRAEFSNTGSVDDIDGLIKSLSKYEKKSVLCSIASLSLQPDNHTHTIRLEVASRYACRASSGTKAITASELSAILHRCLPACGYTAMQEDPPDNMFTDNILYHGGNYIIYPGITEQGGYILQTLLNAIFKKGSRLSKEFKGIISTAAYLLLTISSEMALRAGHSRYIESLDLRQEEIVIPSDTILSKQANAVLFTKEGIDQLFRHLDITHFFLKPFSQPHDDSCFDNNDLPSNPLHIRPFVEMHNNYILLQPSSICCSLNHFIISQAHQQNMTEELYEALNEATFFNINENLSRLGYSRLDYDFPPIPDGLPISEYLFEFDSDKLCYVETIYDDLNNFKDDVIFDHCDYREKAKGIQERHNEISRILLSSQKLNCKQVLILVFLCGVGRSFFLGFQEEPQNTHRIALTDEELEIFVKSTDCEKLCLWKFARSLNRFLDKYPQSSTFLSFLDMYSIYLDHNYSFTLTDDVFSMIFLVEFLGYGKKLRVKARKQIDTHAARIQNILTTVHRQYSEGNIPIYFCENHPSSYRLIEGFKIPVWVMPRNIKQIIDARVLSLYKSFSVMFAYWIWQMTSSLYKSINNLPVDILYIYFDFDDVNKWADHDFHDENKVGVTYTISNDSIYLTIPVHYKSLLHRSDNDGEKGILVKLFEAFIDLFTKLIPGESFDVDEIIKQFNSKADDKYKKMLLLHTALRASLNPENLPELRLIQKNDEDDQLEGLANRLVKNQLPVGPINSKKTELNVLREIVEIYLKRIREGLKIYNYKELLPCLISYQEVIWQNRSQSYLHWPARLACFGEDKDFVEKEAENFTRINATSIALRFLIEFMSAEPPQGGSELSLDDYDKLIAISFGLVNWATLYDQIEHDLFKSNIDILPNGRVGRDREVMEKFKDVYISKKIQEKIDISQNTFESLFERKDEAGSAPERRIDKALVAEFGLNWDEICNFHNTLTTIGFQKKTSCVMIQRDELVREIKVILNWSDETTIKAIDAFSLKNREKWDKPPKEYDFIEDVAPWRYKRRLSYILRCLIQIKLDDKEPILFYGPRQAEESLNYIAELVGKGVYRAKSSEMIKLNGEIQKELGDRFNDKIYDWFIENSEFKVEKNIRVNSFINETQDYGDIDVLLVDTENEKLYSLECKYLYPARNAREMASEAERLFDDLDGRSWTTRHLDRHKVIETNLPGLSQRLNMPVESYKLYSAVLTSEEIPSVYFSKVPLKFINLMSLKRDGLKVLNSLIV